VKDSSFFCFLNYKSEPSILIAKIIIIYETAKENREKSLFLKVSASFFCLKILINSIFLLPLPIFNDQDEKGDFYNNHRGGFGSMSLLM